MKELASLDGTALADLVRKKEISPLQLVDAAIAGIEAVNPKLNSVVTPMYEEARRIAAGPLPDGPFRGVPYLLKDLLAAYGGVRLTGGSRALQNFVPQADSELVARLKRAGLIVVAKTNTPELGILPTTEPHLFGPTHNPWNLERTTGGSSGGSAASVAAGIVPMAHANDGGGSIRIPASCCGLFGLKPTRARTPMGPILTELLDGFVIEHAVTRSVRDSAALLDATAGPEIGAPYWAPPQARPYVEEAKMDPPPMRIAYTTRASTGVAIHPEVVAAIEDTAKLCASRGHEVVEASPQIDGAEISQAFITVWSTGTAIDLEHLALARGGTAVAPTEVEPLTWALAELGRSVPAVTYGVAIDRLQAAARVMAYFLEEHTVFLTPTLAEPPVPLGTFESPADNPLFPIMRAAEWVPFTPFANFSGVPAMSVPLHIGASGLPIGSHFFGRFGDEATLFRLAGQLERARPWSGRRPPVHVSTAP